MRSLAWMSRKIKKQDSVKCLACSRRCVIKKGAKGICGVRKNENGELQLLVYAKPIAINIDPIEKKPFFHFYPGSVVLSLGTVGCNFHCQFCQNHNISQFPKTHNDEAIIDNGLDFSPEKIVEICLKQNIPSIAYTYNEPAIFFEYAYDIAKLANQHGINNIYVSNGFETPEALKKISPYLHAANIDLKSYSDQFYQKICGGRLEPVKENIEWLWKNNIWVEVTTLLITDLNDSTEELGQIAEFLASISPDLPWHVSRFHPCYQMLDRTPTSPENLNKAWEIGKKAGLNHIYIGNVEIADKTDTYCPQCQKKLINRSGYASESKISSKNKCNYCGEKIAGIF